jgi:hypothetical protein
MQANHEVLHQSCEDNILGWKSHQDASAELRKINLDLKDKDCLDFLTLCIEDELSVEEKTKSIIRYPIITYRNRAKLGRSGKLDSFS